jgi:hypothetical protein
MNGIDSNLILIRRVSKHYKWCQKPSYKNNKFRYYWNKCNNNIKSMRNNVNNLRNYQYNK